MKNLLLIITTIFLFSCNQQKAEKTIEQQTITNVVDSFKMNIVDTTYFIDFFEEFMDNEEFQKSRIILPYKIDNKSISDIQEWEHISFYKEYIPILNSDTFRLFDKDVKSTDIEMSMVNFNKKYITNYNFKKIENKWYLFCSKKLPIKNVPDYEFIEFLEKFSNDSLYQIDHIEFPLPFSGFSYSDNEDEPDLVDTTIALKDWTLLNLIDELNGLMVLSNIELRNKYRNIFYRGIGCGIWVKYTFQKINSKWKLTKIEDQSM